MVHDRVLRDLFLLGYFLVMVIRYQIHVRKLPKSLPRHKSRFPLLQFVSSNRQYENNFLKGHQDEDGNPIPIMNMGPGFSGLPIIAISDADAFREILTNPSKYSKVSTNASLVRSILGDTLILAEGEAWKKERRRLTPLFHVKSLKLQIPEIVKEFQPFLEELKTRKELHSSSLVQGWTMRMIIKLIFGNSFEPAWTQKKLGEFLQTAEGVLRISLFFGAWTMYLPIPIIWRMKSLKREIEAKFQEVINQKQQEVANEELESSDSNIDLTDRPFPDLITLLLKSKEPVPASILMADTIGFLTAGHEPTAGLLQWIFYYLTKYPDVQAKFYEEVRSVLGDRTLTEEDLPHLSYGHQIIQETLRLRPVARVLWRGPKEDCILHGVRIPKGSTLFLYTHNVQLDPKHFPNPTQFIPERFAKENHDRHHFSYLPFGAGERACIGQKFASQEALTILTMIIQRFKVEVDHPENVFIGFRVVAVPMNCKMRFIERTQ